MMFFFVNDLNLQRYSRNLNFQIITLSKNRKKLQLSLPSGRPIEVNVEPGATDQPGLLLPVSRGQAAQEGNRDQSRSGRAAEKAGDGNAASRRYQR